MAFQCLTHAPTVRPSTEKERTPWPEEKMQEEREHSNVLQAKVGRTAGLPVTKQSESPCPICCRPRERHQVSDPWGQTKPGFSNLGTWVLARKEFRARPKLCTGEEFLVNQGIDLSPWGLWKNHVALTCMIVIFLTIAYLKLLFLKKYT
ncbi:hypothetical protein QTO34_008212 [Cnephaeus nilssonii]|uniref:Uncharacterized protein n=1 Tax=Cnephaeus nilssonii TaxID=3371016 RepID=A0AA40LVV0_CNENI|nr:hypothetical protein QTO34_008212 [Eptesicus nilssonii]